MVVVVTITVTITVAVPVIIPVPIAVIPPLLGMRIIPGVNFVIAAVPNRVQTGACLFCLRAMPTVLPSLLLILLLGAFSLLVAAAAPAVVSTSDRCAYGNEGCSES